MSKNFKPCITNLKCEVNPEVCKHSIDASTIEYEHYICGLNPCKYSKGWKMLDVEQIGDEKTIEI